MGHGCIRLLLAADAGHWIGGGRRSAIRNVGVVALAVIALVALPRAEARGAVACLPTTDPLEYGFGLIAGPGGVPADMNDRGRVAYVGEGPTGAGLCLFAADTVSSDELVCTQAEDPTSPVTGFAGAPSIDDRSRVAFEGLNAGPNGNDLYVASVSQPLLPLDIPFQQLSPTRPRLNDRGQIAYRINANIFNPQSVWRADPEDPAGGGVCPDASRSFFTLSRILPPTESGLALFSNFDVVRHRDDGRVYVAGSLIAGGSGVGTATASCGGPDNDQQADVFTLPGFDALADLNDEGEFLWFQGDGLGGVGLERKLGLNALQTTIVAADDPVYAPGTALVEGCDVVFDSSVPGICEGGPNDRAVCNSDVDCNPDALPIVTDCRQNVRGVFRWHAGSVQPLVVEGDLLLGSTLQTLGGVLELNGARQVLFFALLADGSGVLVRADPPGVVGGPLGGVCTGPSCVYSLQVEGRLGVGPNGLPIFVAPPDAAAECVRFEVATGAPPITSVVLGTPDGTAAPIYEVIFGSSSAQLAPGVSLDLDAVVPGGVTSIDVGLIGACAAPPSPATAPPSGSSAMPAMATPVLQPGLTFAQTADFELTGTIQTPEPGPGALATGGLAMLVGLARRRRRRDVARSRG